MSQLRECPNCLKYNVGINLEEKDDSMVCPVCESVFGKPKKIPPKK